MSENCGLRNRPLKVEFQILGIPDSGRTSVTLAVTSEIIAWIIFLRKNLSGVAWS